MLIAAARPNLSFEVGAWAEATGGLPLGSHKAPSFCLWRFWGEACPCWER